MKLELGPISFGTASLGDFFGADAEDRAAEILECAWESGIRYFDTAPHYGLGVSERRLGAFLRTKPRSEYVVSTKVGRLLRPVRQSRASAPPDPAGAAELTRVWDPSAFGVRVSLEESLVRLGLDHVDVLYLHDPDQYDLSSGIQEALPALAELRASGVIRASGVGSMSTAALLASADSGLVDLLMVAGRYTLADSSVIPMVTNACERNGVGIVSAAVFNSGLLSTNYPNAQSRFDYATVPADVLARAVAVAGICAEFGLDLPTAALQYTLRDPLVRTVTVGASTRDQLAQNIQRMRQRIPEEFWQRMFEEGLVPR